jgi:hypothetical protein
MPTVIGIHPQVIQTLTEGYTDLRVKFRTQAFFSNKLSVVLTVRIP